MNLGRQALNISLITALAGFTPSGNTDAELTNHATNPNLYKTSAQTITLSQEEIAAITATFAPSKETQNGILAQETFVQEGRGIRATVTLTQRQQTPEDPQAEGYNLLRIKVSGTFKQEYNPATGEGQGVLSIGWARTGATTESPYQSILMYDNKDGSPIFTGVQYNSGQNEVFDLAMPESQAGVFAITAGRVDGSNPTILNVPTYTGAPDTVTEAEVFIEQQ